MGCGGSRVTENLAMALVEEDMELVNSILAKEEQDEVTSTKDSAIYNCLEQEFNERNELVEKDSMKDFIDDPPLAIAIKQGNVDAVKLILQVASKHKVDTSKSEKYAWALTRFGGAPNIIKALQGANPAVVNALIDGVPDPAQRKEMLTTAFTKEKEPGHVEEVEKSAFFWAVESGVPEVVKPFLVPEIGIETWKEYTNDCTAAHLAASGSLQKRDAKNWKEILEILVKSSGGITELIKAELGSDSDPDYHPSVFDRAILSDNLVLVEYLEAEFSIKIKEEGTVSWLSRACKAKSGSGEVFRHFLEVSRLALSDEQKADFVRICVAHGNLGALEQLIDLGAVVDSDVKTEFGSLLHMSCLNKQPHIAKKLAAIMSDQINVVIEPTDTFYGGSCLNLCARFGGKEVIPLLVERLLVEGACDVNACDEPDTRYAPLHRAAKENNADTVRALMAAGADVNLAVPGAKVTPLHIACYDGHEETAAVLLNEGKADITLCDAYDKTPLEAVERKLSSMDKFSYAASKVRNIEEWIQLAQQKMEEEQNGGDKKEENLESDEKEETANPSAA